MSKVTSCSLTHSPFHVVTRNPIPATYNYFNEASRAFPDWLPVAIENISQPHGHMYPPQ